MVEGVPGQDDGAPRSSRPSSAGERGSAVPLTCSFARPVLPTRLTVGLALGVVLVAGVAVAGPADALEDRRRPIGAVTHGPSCGPGVVRVQVTNGTEPHRVALVFDGVEEQDAADLDPGEQVELTSEDVDWGITVDVSVTVADPDGTPEQPLQFQTYTRPSEEDCEAVRPSPTPTPTPTPEPPPTPEPTPTPEPPPDPSGSPDPSTPVPDPTPSTPPVVPPPTVTPPPSTAVPSSPTPTPGPSSTGPSSATPPPGTPSPTTTTATPSSTSGPWSSGPSGAASGASSATATEPDLGAGAPSSPSDSAGSAPVTSVSPGGVVTVRASGFTPGEPVEVSMTDESTIEGAELLSTVTAAADGSVEAVVQIPRSTALGAATLEFVGGESAATARVELQVAARAAPVSEQNGSPAVLAAGLVLLTAAGSLGLVGVRRSRGGQAGGRR